MQIRFWRCLITACLAVSIMAPIARVQGGGGFGDGGGGGGGQGGMGGQGGAANADFDSLIDLIQSTVATETWADTGGGTAEIRPFPTGVMVDAAGALKLVKAASSSPELAARRAAGQAGANAVASDRRDVAADARHSSKLRFVSLPRLEREVVRRQRAHQPFDAAMLTLAGLRRVQYIFVYPESGDLVLAGPAGDWRVDPHGRLVADDTGQSIVRLDDLLTLLRRGQQSDQSFFGCMINPRHEALAATQAFLDRSSARPLEKRNREAWLERIRTTLGAQDIEIFGIDPTSRAARVMVEADVHMKLVGMGLEESVPGVESYLDAVKAAGGQASAMSVLRWWFALNYASIRTSSAAASEGADAYELVGQGVCVLSENEILAAQGRRVHTGQSDPLNEQFAKSFTANFAALARKYPVYSELRTIFDLSLAVALMQADNLAQRANWKPTRLVDAEQLRLPQWPVPRQTETVANLVEVNRRRIIAGVSGGVMVDATAALANRQAALGGSLTKSRSAAPPAAAGRAEGDAVIWWWDAASE